MDTVHPSMFDSPAPFPEKTNTNDRGPPPQPLALPPALPRATLQQSNDDYKKRIENLDKILADLLRGCTSNVPTTSGSMIAAAPLPSMPNVVTPRHSFVSVDDDESQKKRPIELNQEEHSASTDRTSGKPHNPNKKRRIEATKDNEDAFSPSFRAYQTEKWNQKYEELCEFREEKGHCNVPYTHELLIHWVKRQRYQYKLKMEGRPSTLTDERMEKLEEVGFVWDAHASIWHERLQELKAFHLMHGHCNVPSKFPSNPKLAVWTKCQRRQWKLYRDGKSSHMTPERESELESLGFEFEPRAYNKRNQ